MDAMRVVPYQPDLFDELKALVERYRAAYPHAKLMHAGFYATHPARAGGQNLLCMLGDVGRMTGFAPVFPGPVEEDAPAHLPHMVWTVLVVDPDAASPGTVRNALYAAVTARAEAIAQELPPRRVRLASELMLEEQEAIADLEQRGFAPFLQMLVMARETGRALPSLPPLPDVTFVQDRLADADVQAAHIAAYNICFPQSPKTPEALHFLLDAPVWAAGFAVLARGAAGELVGSVLIYGTGTLGVGMVDDVFVLPEWRGRGLAQRLVTEAVRLAAAQGFATLRLEVDAANTPAVAVYRGVGFAVVDREVLLKLDLPRT